MTTDVTLDLSESLEDYLEAILLTCQEKSFVRPKDIAARLNVAGPSVTTALKNLADRCLINYAPYEYITFTASGEQIAKEISRRHERLRSFLCDTLQVESAQADSVACRLEHAIPTDIIDKLVRFVTFIEKCPRGGKDWISGFEHLCDSDGDCKNCSRCAEQVIKRIERLKKENAARKASRIPLSQLTPGKKGRIALFNLSGEALNRLLITGATLGTSLEVDKARSSGGSLNIRVKGVCVSLTEKDAARILVDVIE